ncbi:hypothetical protein ACIQ9E_13890 [Streptomyces sp. NPDC094448]|uniref:hypothetical protein n=1 Tax=Streptomyces sp. NPDC094448 TaxID=3366063 RepID=UPI0037F1D244
MGGAPFGLAPVVGLPGPRTLSAHPGTLADPREIAGLTGLEFLELGPADWRVLLDAGAVPRSLLAAGIEDYGRDPLPTVGLANELLALWGRPPIIRRAVKGDLGPLEYPCGHAPRHASGNLTVALCHQFVSLRKDFGMGGDGAGRTRIGD